MNQPAANPDQQPVELLCDLATALGETGTPAHRLEEALGSCAQMLGVSASFFAMPTAVFAAFEPAPGDAGSVRTRLIRIHAGETNLSRLTDLGRLFDDLSAGRVSVADARARIADLRAQPASYGKPLSVLCFCVVAACAARFFGAGLHELCIAPLAGFVIGSLVVYGGQRFGRIMEFVAGLLAAAIAVTAADRFPPCSAKLIMLSGLIVLIPGLTLTLAVTELATRNLVAGTARLMGALTTFVSIGFGVAIGQRIAQSVTSFDPLLKTDGGPPVLLPEWTLPLSLLIVPFPLLVLFHARLRDAMAITVSAFTAYYGARIGSWALGPEMGVCIAAILVGVTANVYARLTRNPTAVPLLPGILLLVPGSVGFESINSFMARETLAGVATAFNMLFVAVAIVAGLLIANTSAPSKRPL